MAKGIDPPWSYPHTAPTRGKFLGGDFELVMYHNRGKGDHVDNLERRVANSPAVQAHVQKTAEVLFAVAKAADAAHRQRSPSKKRRRHKLTFGRRSGVDRYIQLDDPDGAAFRVEGNVKALTAAIKAGGGEWSVRNRP